MTRRAFLKALGVSAAALAALPPAFALDEALDLDAPLGTGIDLSELDALLKEIYAPLILAQVNEVSTLLRFMEREWKPGDVVPVRIGRNWTVGSR